MYLAKHVGGRSLPKIGRFYNGRHHTTVLHAITKIETLRKTDEAFDSLLDVLTATIASDGNGHGTDKIISPAHCDLIDAVASRVIQRLKENPITRTAHLATETTTENAGSGTPNI
jgi:hypothetical protein